MAFFILSGDGIDFYLKKLRLFINNAEILKIITIILFLR